MYLPFTDPATGQVVPNSWQANTDFGNQDVDGCIFTFTESAVACTSGGQDFGVFDYVMAGIDPAQPNIARMGAISVDFNETFQAWLVDNAGAPVADGNPCGNDAVSIGPDIPCSPIPVPQITGVQSCSPTGCTLNVLAPDVATLKNQSILDDCAVAETFATNCGGNGQCKGAGSPAACCTGVGTGTCVGSKTPGARNLYQGRVLAFKHGACNVSAAAAFDRRTYVMPGPIASGTQVVSPNFIPFSREDANLNGVLDAGEDGTNGGATNGRLDPFILKLAADPDPTGGTNAITVQVPIPVVTGANDCIFLGMGILLDSGGRAADPANTIFGESVITPAISLNTNPIRAGSATPVSDQVIDIIASKTGGKGKVDWTTGIELTTAGFNVIGTKKGGGGEIRLNSALISPKEGTTGKGATYSLTFDGGQLKGSSTIYIEVVKTNGSKERFGPASF